MKLSKSDKELLINNLSCVLEQVLGTKSGPVLITLISGDNNQMINAFISNYCEQMVKNTRNMNPAVVNNYTTALNSLRGYVIKYPEVKPFLIEVANTIAKASAEIEFFERHPAQLKNILDKVKNHNSFTSL